MVTSCGLFIYTLIVLFYVSLDTAIYTLIVLFYVSVCCLSVGFLSSHKMALEHTLVPLRLANQLFSHMYTLIAIGSTCGVQ